MAHSPTERCFVLVFQCSDDHFEQIERDKDGQPCGPYLNCVLDVVKNDLRLDCYYQAHYKLILVKIDSSTINNPVFKAVE